MAARERRVRLVLSDMGNRGERIQRLALCRNVLLAEAATRMASTATLAPSTTSNANAIGGGYVVSLDLDCRHGEPAALLRAVDGMRTAAAPAAGAFDVITANNNGAYRDMWALRSSALHMNYDCFWDFKRMARAGNCKKHRIFVHPGAPPFAVEAAFNGMAIFSAASLVGERIRGCRYTNETADPDSKRIHVVSEHVPYQRCLAERGVRLGLQPSLKTYCHDWSTRHDARRTFMLPNGSVTRLLSRHAKPEAEWIA